MSASKDRYIRHSHACNFVIISENQQYVQFSTIFFFKYISCIAYFFTGIPVISTEVINQTVNIGDTAVVTCLATGKPIPIISWYFNDAPVENKNTTKYLISEMILNPVTKSSTLKLMSLTLSDMGIYTCNAVNQASSDSSSGVVTVNRKCCFLGNKLVIGCLMHIRNTASCLSLDKISVEVVLLTVHCSLKFSILMILSITIVTCVLREKQNYIKIEDVKSNLVISPQAHI